MLGTIAAKTHLPAAVIALTVLGAALILALDRGAHVTPPTAIAPEPLAPAARVSFETIEPALARATQDAAGNIKLTAETGLALEVTIAHLPPETPPEALARMEFLIRKGFPGTAGEQLAALFGEYCRYRALEARKLGPPPAPGDLAAESARHEATVALRRRHFGAARAERLFGRQQALVRHMLALRRLEQDASLSDAQKEAARRALEAEYERRLEHMTAAPLAEP